MQAGATDTLSAALVFTTYGTPTATAPCIIRGYTSVANDGGRGVVSGGGSVACIAAGPVHTKLVDMRFTNCGSNTIVTLNATGSLLVNCEIDTTTGGGFTSGSAIGCYFHNIGAIGVISLTRVMFCTFRNEANAFTQAIGLGGTGTALFNLIDIGGASIGIDFTGDAAGIIFNSIYSNGGTGIGIRNNSAGDERATIINNTIQGFSGSGGIGIQVVGQNADLVGYNLLYNNATNVSITGDVNIDLGNNSVAASSPFTDAANDDFDPIAGLLALYPSYPTIWNNYTLTQQNLIRMAAQYAAGGASGGVLLGNMRGGFTN